MKIRIQKETKSCWFIFIVYLAETMHKKYSTKFVCLSILYVRILSPIFQLPSPCTHLYIFSMIPPPFPQLRTYLMDGLFLNQKTDNNIRISHSLKYKHSKKKIL